MWYIHLGGFVLSVHHVSLFFSHCKHAWMTLHSVFFFCKKNFPSQKKFLLLVMRATSHKRKACKFFDWHDNNNNNNNRIGGGGGKGRDICVICSFASPFSQTKEVHFSLFFANRAKRETRTDRLCLKTCVVEAITQPPTLVCKMEAQLEYTHLSYIRFLHVWRRIIMLSRRLLAKFPHWSSARSLLRVHCWLGLEIKERL